MLTEYFTCRVETIKGVSMDSNAKESYDNATSSPIFALMLIVLYIAIFPSVGE